MDVAQREQARTTHDAATPVAANAAGKQPGKATLTEQIMPYAGESFSDGHGYVFVVKPDGSFECIDSPDHKTSVHAVMSETNRYEKVWHALAGVLQQAPPKHAPVAPAPTASPKASPTPTAPAQPKPEPSLVERAAKVVQDELGAIKDGVQHTWHRVVNALGGENDPAPAPSPTDAAKSPSTPAATTPAPATKPAAKAAPTAPVSREVRTDIPKEFAGTRTLDGDPLDAALTRTTGEYGPDGTNYLRADWMAKKIQEGDPAMKTFFCSGLQMWAMAATGYNLNAPIVAADGKPITGQKYKQQGGKNVKDGRPVTPTLYKIINGQSDEVETIMRAGDLSKGIEVELLGTGYMTERAEGALPVAMRGAAGALALSGLGAEVPNAEQAPGDMVQTRYQTPKSDTDKTLVYDGHGHAWLVDDVKAHGAAWFGEAQSPTPSKGKLTGWHEDVDFEIHHDTDPHLVGDYIAIAAVRVEANVNGAMEGNSTKKDAPRTVDTANDGGVQRTSMLGIEEEHPKRTGTVRFVGRLGTSPWFNRQKATRESSELLAAPKPDATNANPDASAKQGAAKPEAPASFDVGDVDGTATDGAAADGTAADGKASDGNAA